jgi:Tfp pilus assembly protein PilX
VRLNALATRAMLTPTRRQQDVTSRTKQLEALEARLRETEERLKQAKSSPPTRKNSQRRTPVEDTFPPDAKARIGDAQSPLAMRRQQEAAKENARLGALPQTPPSASDGSTDSYVLVDRPPTARSTGERA